MVRQKNELFWPVKGVVRNTPYQQQAPFSSPGSLNVRSYIGGGERRRGGSRPGFEKSHSTELGSGSAVNLLNEVSFIKSTNGIPRTELVAISGGQFYRENYGTPTTFDGVGTVQFSTTSPLLSAEMHQKLFISDYDESGYVYKAADATLISNVLTSTGGANFTTLGITAGMIVALTGEGTAQNEKITIAITGNSESADFILAINSLEKTGEADNSFNHKRKQLEALAYNASAADVKAAIGAHTGIGATNMTVTGSAGGPWTVEFNGDLAGKDMYAYLGDLAYLSIDADATVDLKYQQDREAAIIAETDPDLVERIEPPGILVTRVQAGGKPTKGTAKVVTVATGGDTAKLTLSGFSGPDSVNSTLTYSIWRSPKVYDADGNGSIAVWETRTYEEEIGPASEMEPGESAWGIRRGPIDSFTRKPRISRYQISPRSDYFGSYTLNRWKAGDVPVGCPAIAQWANRIVMTGSPLAPHAVWYSREGDPYDFDVGRTDAQAAFVATGPVAGQLGEPGVALMPHSHSCLIVGCTGSMWVQSGNPRLGGQIRQLSSECGIVGNRAWCHAPSRNSGERVLLFLSSDGLYAISGECGSPPVSISRENLPEDLLGVNATTHWVNLAYCPRFQGVHVLAQPRSSGTAALYWFDWKEMAWWPEAIATGVAACTLYTRGAMTGTDSPVIHGGTDGYLRRAAEDAEDDDGTAISSHLYIGPFSLGDGPDNWGSAAELLGELGSDSGDVTWSIYTGFDGEDAYEKATPAETGTWTPGFPLTSYPRCAGGAMVLKLAGAETDERWSFERALLGRQPMGKRRS